MLSFSQQLTSLRPRVGAVTFIAIDGRAGSGKSTLASLLSQQLHAEVIHTDDFGGWENPFNWHPRIIGEVFAPIIAGEKALSYERARWWDNHYPEAVLNQPVTPIMIIEGVGSSRQELREYLSLCLFVDTPRELCLKRGVARDLSTGKSTDEITKVWKDWSAQEDIYFSRDNPRATADIVVQGNLAFETQLQLPTTH
jgi:uridine kinase